MCVNVGAIMTAGVLASGHADKSVAQLVQHTMDMWGRLSGNIGEVKQQPVLPASKYCCTAVGCY